MTAPTATEARPQGQRDRTARWLVAALGVLAAALAVNALLGPLVGGPVTYHYGTSMTNQGIGLDAVTLVVAAPLAGVAAVLVGRGHAAGPVLAFAPATFAAYMMPQYVIGPDYLHLPGDNERAIPFQIAVFVLAVATLVAAWRAVGAEPLAPGTARGARLRAGVLLALAAFIALGRWLPAVLDVLDGEPVSRAYREDPTAFWLVAFLDLGLVVPAAVAAGVGLLAGVAGSWRAAYAVIGWCSLVPASVAAMAITMQLRDDPQATAAATATTTVAGIVLTAAAAALYRPLFGPAARGEAP